MGMVDAVLSGIGIGLLLCFLADNEKDLIRMAEPLYELDTDLWILTHPDINQIDRIKALAEFFYKKLTQATKLPVSKRATRGAAKLRGKLLQHDYLCRWLKG